MKRKDVVVGVLFGLFFLISMALLRCSDSDGAINFADTPMTSVECANGGC